MSVTPEVVDWVRKAKDDLAAARWLAEGERQLCDQMGFFCQSDATMVHQALAQAERVRALVRRKPGLSSEKNE